MNGNKTVLLLLLLINVMGFSVPILHGISMHYNTHCFSNHLDSAHGVGNKTADIFNR